MSRDLQQQRDSNAETQSGAEVDVDAEHKPEVSRKSSNAGLRREVQMKGGGASADPAQVHEAAQQGVASGGATVPHMDKIQRSFGSHDVSSIQAHVGGAAKGATQAMGAEAYASGNQVAFGKQPDLHTAAHEVAHVVQQRNGVSLSGGVGAAGDSHEQHADKVADKVVAGESVEHMLGPAKPASAASAPAVQRKPADKAADPKAAHDKSDSESYGSVQAALLHFAKGLQTWGLDAEKWMSSDASTEAGTAPAEQAIQAIYDRALNDAQRIEVLIGTADKSTRTTLSPEVRKVQGAYTRFYAHMQRPVAWMEKKQQHIPLQPIQTIVDSYTQRIGYDQSQTLEPDVATPEGDEKKLSKEMVDSEFSALEAAIKSVKAGNDGDAMRVNLHVAYLDGVAKEHSSELKAHKPQLKKLVQELAEIRKISPALDQRLSEASFHLNRLFQ